MKILLGYGYYHSPVDVRFWVEAWLRRLRTAGFEVDPFYLTLNPPAPCLTWGELDERWRRRDPELLKKYEILAERLENYDVFLNWHGINIHPEFLPQLKTFNAFACHDDPENSKNLSRPVATSYDMCFVGNIAELDTYRSWGVKHVFHWPLGFRADDFDPELTEGMILEGDRSRDLILICDYVLPWRRAKLDAIAAAFPNSGFYGRGWPSGFLPESHRILAMQRAKIGPNFHHSTGPINFRTFILPANGVLLICDNRKHLAKLFELEKEAVGFETMDEAIDLCRYYLDHDRERREIAAGGWKRSLKDYNEVTLFRRVVGQIENTMKEKTAPVGKP
jgi:spore maturation protein CgeB